MGPVPHDPGPAVWFDAQDISTLFKDAAGTQPVLATNDPVQHWVSKGSARNFALTQSTGAAMYKVGVLSGNRSMVDFGSFFGQFTDSFLIKANNTGITMFIVLNNICGNGGVDGSNGHFWSQTVTGDAVCAFEQGLSQLYVNP